MNNVSNNDNIHPPLPCPPWCTTDHAKHDRFEQYVEPVMDLRTHSRNVAVIDNPGAGVDKRIWVSVSITDDLGEHVRGEVLVTADNAECMRPATGTEVARAITEAARLATGQADDTEPDPLDEPLPAAPGGYRFNDRRWRVELRVASPDLSLPNSGQLVGYAVERDGTWWCHHRDGRVLGARFAEGERSRPAGEHGAQPAGWCGMSQLTGAFTIELAVDQIADRIADRVLERLQAAAREGTEPDDQRLVSPRTAGGADIYDRPDPEREP